MNTSAEEKWCLTYVDFISYILLTILYNSDYNSYHTQFAA